MSDGEFFQPSGQRIDEVEQSKRRGVFVCDMGGCPGVRDDGRRGGGMDGGGRWVAEVGRECSKGKG